MGRRTETDPKSGKPVVLSAGKFMGINTIFGRDGDHGTPYMTRAWFWRLRLHIFHRPDQDGDCHDHPWDFWTFPLWPLGGYVEEVVTTETHYLPISESVKIGDDNYLEHSILGGMPVHERLKKLQVVPSLHLSFRPATHCHRVLGAYRRGTSMTYAETESGQKLPNYFGVDPTRKLVTLVWISKPKRAWGFLKNRDGQWRWVAWRDYVFSGGKDGPCQ